MQACSFFSSSFLEFNAFTPTFSCSILFNKFVQAFDTLKTPLLCFGTRETLKKVDYLSFSQAFFLLLFHFHINLNNHHLTDHQLASGGFLPAIACIGRTKHKPRSDLLSRITDPILGGAVISLCVLHCLFIRLTIFRSILLDFPAMPNRSRPFVFASECSLCRPYCPSSIFPSYALAGRFNSASFRSLPTILARISCSISRVRLPVLAVALPPDIEGGGSKL